MIGPITIPEPRKYTVTEMIEALKCRPQLTFGNVAMLDGAVADQIIKLLEPMTAKPEEPKKLKRLVDTFHLAVDAGNISVLTFALLRLYGDEPKQTKNTQLLALAPGKYKVQVKIPSSWNGKLHETFEVTIGENDGIVIGDACYSIRDMWDNFLNDTNYLDNLPEGQGGSVSTGGDGTFKTKVVVTNA